MVRKCIDDAAVVRVGIGEIEVALRSEHEGTRNEFAALYAGYPRRGRSPEPPIEMALKTERVGRLGAARYRIHGDGKVMGRPRGRAEALPFLEWGINWCVMDRRDDFLLVHAASMSYRGAGVILAGASGAGKSTLSAALLAHGWDYHGDEFALIHPDTLELHAYPKAICLKSGSFGLADDLGFAFAGRRHHVKGLKGKVGYVNPHEVRENPVGQPAPIRFVVFPKYVPGVAPALLPMTRADSAFAILAGTLNRARFGARAVEVASDVVRGADCYRLESGSLPATCDLLRELIAG